MAAGALLLFLVNVAGINLAVTVTFLLLAGLILLEQSFG